MVGGGERQHGHSPDKYSLESIVPGVRNYWIPFSMTALQQTEKLLLGELKSFHRSISVSVLNKACTLQTLVVEMPNADVEYRSRVPIVLLHGFGGGSALWVRNLDALASIRPVYAVDLLGFGRSSRFPFSSNESLVEKQWVDSLEHWRQQMQLNKFVLLGHSFGAYISASYALLYGDHISHLLLAEPWGFPPKPTNHKSAMSSTVPTWIRIVADFFSQFTPLMMLRLAGPLGPYMLRKVRPDIGRKFYDDVERQELIFDYIYHCNAQQASGEQGFQTISLPYGWAKYPMVKRLPFIRRNCPITFIYGSRSWIDQEPGYVIQKQLRHRCPVKVEIIRGSGHHVYVDNYDVFNELVLRILQ